MSCGQTCWPSARATSRCCSLQVHQPNPLVQSLLAAHCIVHVKLYQPDRRNTNLNSPTSRCRNQWRRISNHRPQVFGMPHADSTLPTRSVSTWLLVHILTLTYGCTRWVVLSCNHTTTERCMFQWLMLGCSTGSSRRACPVQPST